MTPERFHRLQAVLARRQPDLTVLLDNVHKPHNFSAILRSCDAVGVFEAHAVWPQARLRPSHMTSGGAGKWVQVRTHETLENAFNDLRTAGFQFVAAHPADTARDFREVDYTRPTAVLLGAELDGVSPLGVALADIQVRIPMLGLGHSLNVSVAGAVILMEAGRQRTRAGLYARSRLPPELRAATLFEWAHPEVADYCRRHTLPYPALDEDGNITQEFRFEGLT